MSVEARTFDFDHHVYVMGILNVTPDSFSDGGMFLDAGQAIDQAREMVAQGADIIDIGGESSRPRADPVSEEEELSRVLPVIKIVSKEVPVPISIDTTKAKVASKAIENGASIVNDISGLQSDKEMVRVVSGAKCPVCIMHMKGSPKTMQQSPCYDDVIAELKDYFKERLELTIEAGIDTKDVWIDPGIGFGKRLQDNLEILNNLDQLKELGNPILVGPSRKSFIGAVLDQPKPDKRLFGTLGSIAVAVQKGASIVRVHDVKPVKEMLAVMEAIRSSGVDHQQYQYDSDDEDEKRMRVSMECT